MDLSATYEYVVSPKKQTSYRIKRALMLLAYFAYVAVLLIVGLNTRLLVPMMALIPLSTWIIVWLTWRYVSVEYEYRTASDTGFTTTLKTCALQTNLKPGRHYTYTLSVGIDDVKFLLEIIEDRFK